MDSEWEARCAVDATMLDDAVRRVNREVPTGQAAVARHTKANGYACTGTPGMTGVHKRADLSTGCDAMALLAAAAADLLEGDAADAYRGWTWSRYRLRGQDATITIGGASQSPHLTLTAWINDEGDAPFRSGAAVVSTWGTAEYCRPMRL